MATTWTATANLYTGRIAITPGEDDELPVVDGFAVNELLIDPWGVDEAGMGRADQALAEEQLTRVSEWTNDEYPTCKVSA
jgi:hypothetical protein